jgi:hypothetical protein
VTLLLCPVTLVEGAHQKLETELLYYSCGCAKCCKVMVVVMKECVQRVSDTQALRAPSRYD